MTQYALAKPTFTIPDNVAVVAPYGVPSTIVNDYQSVLTNDLLGKIPFLSKLAKPILSGSLGKLMTDAAALTYRLTMSVPGLLSNLRNATTAIQKGITTANAIENQIKVAYSGVEKIVKSGDLGSISGIASVINTVAKSTSSIYSIVDNSGMSSLIAGVTKEAHGLGITNAFSAMSDGITDRSTLLGAAKLLVNEGIRDVRMLTDIANTPIIKDLGIIKPNTLKSIIQATNSVSTSTNSALQSWSTIESTLSKVDSTWNTITRGDTSILSTKSIGTLSQSTRDGMRKLVSVSLPMTEVSYTPVGATDPVSVVNLTNAAYDLPATADLCAASTFTTSKKDFTEVSIDNVVKSALPLSYNTDYPTTF